MKKVLAACLVIVCGVVAGAIVGFVSIFNPNGLCGSTQSAPDSTAQPFPGNQSGLPDANPALFAEVDKKAAGNNWLIASMYFGSDIENNRQDTPDKEGAAWGPYQIQHPGVVHPDITPQQALDPVYATDYMYPEYLAALQDVSPILWVTNPKSAAVQTAYNAERPAILYSINRPADVNTAWNNTLDWMQARGISTDFGANSGVPTQAEMQQVNSLSSSVCDGGLTGGVDPAKLVSYSGATGARQTVLQTALAQVGLPYAWGGGDSRGPTHGICASGAAAGDCGIIGFDCSGLVLYSFAQIGIMFPHSAAIQWQMTNRFQVSLEQAQPGDLVFFTGSDGTRLDPGHVGVYIGDGQMIEAPQSGQNLKVVTITTTYWQSSFVGITDPFALGS